MKELMLIFNTTFHVEDSVMDAYLEYMKRRYIPVASGSGFFQVSCFAQIYAQHEESGKSYSLQLKVKNIETLNYWLEKEGGELNKEMTIKFGDKVAGFSTLLEEIDY